MDIKTFIGITRASFLPASIIPFLTGVAFALRQGLSVPAEKLIPAFIGVATAHLAGNVLNNYYDHVSGADSVKTRTSPFFGGSKLIVEGKVTPRTVLKLGLFLLSVSVLCGLFLFAVTGDFVILVMMIAAGIMTAGYTAPPLKLAYRGLGEIDIFLLFGVFLVTGSYYLFSGAFSLPAFLISLPAAFLVGAVIICNEFPDVETDARGGKKNLVSIVGHGKAYLLYLACMAGGMAGILVNVFTGNLPAWGAAVLLLFALGIRPALILKEKYNDLNSLVAASGMTILLHGTAAAAVAALAVMR